MKKIKMQIFKKLKTKSLVLLMLVVLAIGLAGYITWKRNKSITAKAETNCSYTDNRRIICFAKQVTGYRYANLNKNADINWSKYWNQNIAGDSSLGYNEEKWYNTERLDSSRNFLGCSGYVSVVFYLANNKKPIFGHTGSQDYRKDSRFTRIEGNKWYNKLSPGDLVIRKSKGAEIGHVAIVEKVSGGTLYTYEAASHFRTTTSNPTTPVSGQRTWRIKNDFFYDYGLRWNDGFNHTTSPGAKSYSSSSMKTLSSNTAGTPDFASIEPGTKEPEPDLQ